MGKKKASRSSSRAPETGGVPLGFHERLVVGYHGCERTTARRVLLGEEELTPSTNDYDWLGHGIYFWEHGLARALQFAEEKRERHELEDPVVIGAYVQLGQCFDLTDVWATRLLARYFEELRVALTKARKPLPVNGGARDGVFRDRLLRRLDSSTGACEPPMPNPVLSDEPIGSTLFEGSSRRGRRPSRVPRFVKSRTSRSQ
jgi:hypothetical protein